MKMRHFTICLSFFTLFLGFHTSNVNAQQNLVKKVELNWRSNGISHESYSGNKYSIPYFEDALISSKSGQPLPLYSFSFPMEENASLDVSITDEAYEVGSFVNDGEALDAEISIETNVSKDRNKHVGYVSFVPMLKAGGQQKRLVQFTLNIRTKNTPVASTKRGPPNTFNSVLEDGDIIKVAVFEEGMHKITYDFLNANFEANIDNVDPRNIQVFGNGGGMLPQFVGEDRYDDLVENPIEIVGGDDGSFDQGDFILFYATGASVIKTNSAQTRLEKPMNVFDNQNHYFIKVGNANGNRIQAVNSISSTNYNTSSFSDIVQLEEDKFNIIHDFALGQGSGNQWFWDKFEVLRDKNYNFSFPNVIPGQAKLNMVFAGRSENPSFYNVTIAGQNFTSQEVRRVNTGDIETQHARNVRLNTDFNISEDNNTLQFSYPANGASSTGWLDYIELNARRSLQLVNGELIFRDLESIGQGSTTFNLSNVNDDVVVWDVTRIEETREITPNRSGQNLSFGAVTDELKTFIAFDKNNVNREVEFVSPVENQNIHGIESTDMVIIYHKDFLTQVERLAEHRRQHSGLTVEIVEIESIMNEFASGNLDPTAIRDFAQMIFERDPNFRFLLLFGDGSFDPRNIYDDIQVKSDFIPVYEVDSLNLIFSYPSDDYYGLISEGEGASLIGGNDLAIGRIPVKNNAEAANIVNKIISYDTSPEHLGDWRNRLVFVADDEDTNAHIDDADGIARTVEEEHFEFNQNKIYIDAFKQVSTPGGEKYPDVIEELNASMFQGALTVNYLGHGGSKGWAQERILGLEDIAGWSNRTKLPLLVTATCSFSGYDDPAFVTAGERTFLNSNGGSIGLMTTTRAVFAGSNEKLTRAVFEEIFERDEQGRVSPIGEVIRRAKNSVSSGNVEENSRKFTLLGDPSMRLAVPLHQVHTSTINGQNANDTTQVTIKALERVTITGEIRDNNGNLLSNFNGKVFPIVYDKTIQIKTLRNDPGSLVRSFDSQQNIIFKGAATVSNGKFSFQFVVPRDINYALGEGKISYYATDEISQDATGAFSNFQVGGADQSAQQDDQGPVVEVFMDDESFVFGGTTDENPILLVKLSDDSGINVAGSSVGHDLTGILDEDTQNSYLLNDFYESELDDFTKGTVRFPLFDLEEGRHEIRVKAWDVANNSSEGFTEFVVSKTSALALQHVLNYPNPFTTNTNFLFEHNLEGQLVDVQIRIFTISGVLVKTITEENVLSEGNRVTGIQWDGLNDFGGQLARGIYLYKVKVAPSDSNLEIESAESEFEKLVILK